MRKRYSIFSMFIVMLLSMLCFCCGSSDDNNTTDGDKESEVSVDGDGVIDGDLDSPDGDKELDDKDQDEDPELELGDSLNAGMDDPVLLSVAAVRSRSQYMVDETYTLSRTPDGGLQAASFTNGEVGFAFKSGDKLIASESDYHKKLTITHTASDYVLAEASPITNLDMKLTLAALTSPVVGVYLDLSNTSDSDINMELLVWLRNCERPFTNVKVMEDGLSENHNYPADLEQKLSAPGTFYEDRSGVLISDTAVESITGIKSCGTGVADDIAQLNSSGAEASGDAAMMLFKIQADLAAGESKRVALYRAVAKEEEANGIQDEIKIAREVDLDRMLLDGAERVKRIPELAGLSREDYLVYRSSYILVEQDMMPAEGLRSRDYFIFNRDDSCWFCGFGQHIHEALAMILMAKYEQQSAIEVMRGFLDMVD